VVDSSLCSACGLCETKCVKKKSAVVCRNDYDACAHCRRCRALKTRDSKSATGWKNVCPVDAIRRVQTGENEHEYVVDEDLCNGCGQCVAQCRKFGGASLRLVIRQDRCDGCNRCSIADACPSAAVVCVKESVARHPLPTLKRKKEQKETTRP